MGKKSKSNRKKAVPHELPEKVLPQNIFPIGERVEENKNIYILQSTYKEIHRFTQIIIIKKIITDYIMDNNL